MTGIDFSARFIRIAMQLKEKGVTYYDLAEEGEIVSYHEARLGLLGLQDTIGRVEFLQGDATNLKPQFTGYDLILAANLLDRIHDPKGFLASIHERLNVGGILVMTSPYTWLEEFTKKENWPGGIRKAGEPYWTFDALKDLLAPRFTHADAPRDVEFVIRETRRKFQHTHSEVTVWERVRQSRHAKPPGAITARSVSEASDDRNVVGRAGPRLPFSLFARFIHCFPRVSNAFLKSAPQSEADQDAIRMRSDAEADTPGGDWLQLVFAFCVLRQSMRAKICRNRCKTKTELHCIEPPRTQRHFFVLIASFVVLPDCQLLRFIAQAPPAVWVPTQELAFFCRNIFVRFFRF